jgi:hypothetical protein
MCLAYADWRASNYRWSNEPRDEQLARALAEAERAVALDPRDPDALYVLSLPARSYRGQRQRTDEALRHCLRLSSSYPPRMASWPFPWSGTGGMTMLGRTATRPSS